MQLEDLLEGYVLNDGEITALKVNLDYINTSNSTATVGLIVRKPAEKKKFIKCKVELKFGQVVEVGLNEDFGTAYYSDIVLVKLENGFYYLSLDPFGNSGQPLEDDNLVIIAQTLAIEEKE